MEVELEQGNHDARHLHPTILQLTTVCELMPMNL